MNLADWVAPDDDHDALVYDGRTWTSHVLADRSARLARALIDLGLRPGDRVIAALPNGPELVVAFPAILRAGGVAVLVSPNATAAELERVARHADTTAIVTTSVIAPHAPAASIRIVVGRNELSGWHELDALVEHHTPLATAIERGPGDPAQIAYTSGTTGPPKGVVYSQATLMARLRYLGVQQLKRDTSTPIVLLSVLPMAHAFGMILLFYRFIPNTKIVCLAEFEPRRVLEAIERHRVEFMPLVPTMCEALLACPDLARCDLSSLRSVSVGGAPVTMELVDRMEAAIGLRPTVAYGMTELPGITFNPGTVKRGSVGRLIPGVTGRIVDDRGQELPQGEIGEIAVKAPWMSGIYHRQDADNANKVRDGWLYTGDLGYFDADRDLFIVGRSKEIVIQAGHNVYPHEVADVVRRLPDVQDCAVVGVQNELLGEEVVACVVLRTGAALTGDAVVAHCRAALDTRKVPVSVHFVAALPRTELGKVQVHVLREQIERARARVHETVLVRRLRSTRASERPQIVRDMIVARLRDVLRTDHTPSDARATFGELGLDSLGAVELSHAIATEIGRPIPPTLTFGYPTVDAVTRFVLAELFGTEPEARRPRQPIGARERIAVIGVGCRLPGGVATPAQLWDVLANGVDTTRDIDRWDMDAIYDATRGTPGKTYTRRAALVDSPELFDAGLFGLTAREARELDPQHRLLLMTTWEAFEHAGRDPLNQHDEHAGVFVGISGSSYPSASALGTLPGMAVGRISYFFDLDGPAFALDTACSSSLVAIHNAIGALRRGECDLALAGGVHVMCTPDPFIGLSAIQALAPDGRCKAFDARADGFGRGEGCVMFVLRRHNDAAADHDRILGVIRGSAINHDGRASSLTAPNGKAQEAVIRTALADAAAAARDVDYLEAHGTGTPLGDPIEIQAASAVLCADRDPARPLVVGSVKTNLGHSEAAAGAAGLLKVLLGFAHDTIPATLHQQQLNPMLQPYTDRLVIANRAIPWPRGSSPRLAAVTSLGMSGTNAHLVIEEPPASAIEAPSEARAQLLCLSARTDAALAELAGRYAKRLAHEPAPLADVCYTAAVGRAHLAHRLSAVGVDKAAVVRRLDEYADGVHAPRGDGRAPRVGFVFTGQGSQHVGMSRRLYQTQRVFRHALQRCAEILQPLLPRPLLDVLFVEARSGELELDDTALAQPALFALEWSLAQLWLAWGVEPTLVLGHSLGEYVAACVAGVFGVEDGLRLVVERGRLMQALPRDGAMVALATDEQTALAAIGRHAEHVSIASVNGPRAIVLSGEATAVDEIVSALRSDGVRAQALRVSHAFHSPLMNPILDAFERVAARIAFAPPRIAFVSTVTGAVAGEGIATAAYWRGQIREPVRCASAMSAMAGAGAEVIVEVGPSPILIAIGQQCTTNVRTWLPSLRRDRDDNEQMLDSLGQLYVHGLAPRWSELWRDSKPRKLALPTYPFEYQPYWTTLRSGRVAPRSASSSARGNRQSARAALVRELHAMPTTDRIAHVMRHVRGALARVLGRDADSVPADANLLDSGLDSLRVIELVGGLRQRLGVELSAAELIARPTLAAFAAHVGDRIASTASASSSQWIELNAAGGAPPIIFMHPSGGEVTAYLQLRTCLGDAQPLYAIQSRALAAPDSEHATLAAMAADYADQIMRAYPRGPHVLVGWSMGGVTAHAVAVELERRDNEVALVGAIDSPARNEAAGPLHQLVLALTGVLRDLPGASPQRLREKLRDTDLRALVENRAPPAELLAWCEAGGLVPAQAISAARFDAMMRLRYHHFRIVGEHPRGVIRAPMRVWWAERALGDWSPHAGGGVRETVVGGDHFTIVGTPHVETIAAELRAAIGGG